MVKGGRLRTDWTEQPGRMLFSKIPANPDDAQCPGKKKKCGFGDLKYRLTRVCYLLMICFYIFDVGVCKLAISPGDDIDKPVGPYHTSLTESS